MCRARYLFISLLLAVLATISLCVCGRCRTGEEWLQARIVLNKKMLPPKKVVEFIGPLNEVTSDLVEKLRYIRDTEGDKALTTSIQNELYKWSMECKYMQLYASDAFLSVCVCRIGFKY